MNEIKKQVIKTVAEIVIVIILVIGSYIVWDNLEINKYRDIAATSYSNGTISAYEKEAIAEDSLIPVKDEVALNAVKPGILYVENSIETKKTYTLFMAINKESTLDYKYLNVSIDNKIYNLNEMNPIEEDNIIFIMFDSYTITDFVEHEVRIWLNEEATIEAMGKSLTFGFNIKENSQI